MADVLQGNLDLLVLKALQLQPLHGWAISKRIRQVSRDVLVVNQGSLYPCLYRLEQQGLLSGAWSADTSESRRPVKVYRLTADGRKRLEREVSNWCAYSMAVAALLDS